MTWSLDDHLHRATRADPPLDYCQWPYDPPRLPTADSWRSDALLYQSFAHAGLSARALAVCDAIRTAYGPFRTVWGVKQKDGALSWEFYFYDYARLGRDLGTADLARALKDHVPFDVPLTGDALPYFMFSIELTADHLDHGAQLDQIDLYIGNPGSAVSSGICYGLTRMGCEMRNFYFFFDAATQREEIEGKLISTAQIPAADLNIPDLLWPDIDAQTIVIANKRQADGVYFSRISADHLVACLDRLAYPAPIRAFARDNAHRFAHLMFDIGYDWSPAPGGGVQFDKGSFYGLL